ncbi:MAG TPA: 30S ribosomal protein THX [Gemmatimonadales bacterium]|nr:30S ribosomal protein THX [Gemmatimonadales bacterium]
MGKGDRRTKRGKIYRGTYGNTRLKKKRKKASAEGKPAKADS